MMKFYGILFIGLFLTLTGFCQVNKIYITSKGQFTDDPKSAVTYVLVKKITDSDYSVRQFDMRDTLRVRGNYKDSLMSIPNGRFYYYYKYHIGYKTSRFVDTNSYLKYTGFFLNGVKTGQWIEYVQRDKKGCIYTFEHDKLNGLYQCFYSGTGKLSQEGNYVDDKREGEWNTFAYRSDDESPVYTDVFLHDKLDKRITHLKDAVAPLKYDDYIQKALKHQLDSLVKNKMTVTVFITEKGNIDSVIMNKPLNEIMTKAVTLAFLKSPQFQPAFYDNIAFKQKYIYDFSHIGRLRALQELSDEVINEKRNEIISRHVDDIGRGLNSLGIGKPVD